MPGEFRRRKLQPVFAEASAVHLEQLDVDQHFGPRLVDHADETAGGLDALCRVGDRDGVGALHAADSARVDHDAQQIHRLFEVGVAEIERPDDVFLVLAPLGGRVGNDRDRARRRHAIEVLRARRNRLQRLVERLIANLDGNGCRPKRRIEDDVHFRQLRERADDDVLLASRKMSSSGSGSAGTSRPGSG